MPVNADKMRAFGTRSARAPHLVGTILRFTFALSSGNGTAVPLQYPRNAHHYVYCIRLSELPLEKLHVTYRSVAGRNIASEKVAPRPLTRAPGAAASVKLMSQRQMVFGLINRFAKNHESDINQSFNKTKYGTARNYFFKVNYAGMAAAFEPLYARLDANASDTMAITDTEIEEAVSDYATENPTAIYRVRKTGSAVIYLTGEWTTTENPVSGTVEVGGTTLHNGDKAKSLATGDAFAINGQNLTDGEITLGLADSSNGSPVDTPISEALTESSVSEYAVGGNIAAAANGKYLMNVKVGTMSILTLKQYETGGGEGTLG